MPFELGENSFEALSYSLAELSRRADLNTAQGRRMAERSLRAGANVILEQMKRNASKNIKTGRIYRSLRIVRVQRAARGNYFVKVGLPKIEGSDYYYAAPLEYGHGGPHGPAAPHPFVRPAYDAKSEEAYRKMREEIEMMLFEQQNS